MNQLVYQLVSTVRYSAVNIHEYMQTETEQ